MSVRQLHQVRSVNPAGESKEKHRAAAGCYATLCVLRAVWDQCELIRIAFVPYSGFATAAAGNNSQGLDRSLKRLDEDVRRSGRISRRDLEEVLEEIRVNRSATSAQSLLVIRCCGESLFMSCKLCFKYF